MRINFARHVELRQLSVQKSEIGSRAADIISDLCDKLEQCKFETNSSVSIGIAQAPEDAAEFNRLYNCADKALYYVKQNGKNSYHFFSDKLQTEKKRGEKNVDLNYLVLLQSHLYLCGQLQKAKVVGDGSAALAYPLGDLLLSHAGILNQMLVCKGNLYSIQVLALDVLHEGHLHDVLVVDGTDVCRDSFQTSHL